MHSEPIPEENNNTIFEIFEKVVSLNFDKEVIESEENVLVFFWSSEYTQYINKFVEALNETWVKYSEES